MFIAIKRHWPPIPLKIVAGSFPIPEKALMRHKPQFHQLPTGIID
jgi:hypothetical protein